jgi:hypothetical protein
MSFSELQNQATALSVAERVQLIEHLRLSLTANELEAFYINQAEEALDALEAGEMKVYTPEEMRQRRASAHP